MGRIGQRSEQVRRADRGRRGVGIRLERSAHPCGLQPLGDTRRQPRLATQIARKPVDRREQCVPDAIDVQLVHAQYRQQIAISELEQFDEPMFYLDVAMRAGLAEAGGFGERSGAVAIQTTQERGGVVGSHGR